MQNLHTPNTRTLSSDPFWVLKFCKLRGEGRRGWGEGRVKNGVRMKHMITYSLLYLVFEFGSKPYQILIKIYLYEDI